MLKMTFTFLCTSIPKGCSCRNCQVPFWDGLKGSGGGLNNSRISVKIRSGKGRKSMISSAVFHLLNSELVRVGHLSVSIFTGISFFHIFFYKKNDIFCSLYKSWSRNCLVSGIQFRILKVVRRRILYFF